MRSPKFLHLVAKELRELTASRSFWLLLLFVGLLVGHGFITAVGLYAEMSGSGGPAALPQGLNSLDGVIVPTWGAYDLAATLLFPFVAIRLISAEKESGALKLLLQLAGTMLSKLAAKGLVLLNHGETVAEGTVDELRGRAGLSEGGIEEIFLALT